MLGESYVASGRVGERMQLLDAAVTARLAAVQRLFAWSSFVSPTLRCHYGGILIAIGRWPEAEASCWWELTDTLGLLRQVGALPPAAA